MVENEQKPDVEGGTLAEGVGKDKTDAEIETGEFGI